ncbi:MAG: polymerase III subunit beta protein [Candidatus Woesebacteria bacterium GW2011_GWB1_45_5]|uniref:Beta sliding clamp n=1 Tax=Candidatus Woesebacteria bacterium GW2011_GWB1_45_5 TaxID=1618581 RepID=A0A0G1MPZ2_9BACT|nr:MAG: polymerase III subunit beta protein [Candidatus Woesebacteria bacterium GW2011_GWB1_45_5]
MKLTVLQESLQKALNTASRFASTRAQLPILGNILFAAHKTNVHLCSTNLEISVAVQIGAKVEKEGKISVPARVISELVANLPKDTLTIEVEKEQMKINSKGFSSTVLGMDPSDFPKIPSSIDKDKSLGVPKSQLVDALSQVIFAASVDETRPVLTGVLFILESGSLTLVATDGFRLSQKKIDIKGAKGGVKIVLPKLVLSELGRVETDTDIYLELNQKEKQAIFGLGDTVLTSRLLEGEYPDFEKIIPKKSEIQVFLDKDELLRAVKLASVFAREAANIVKLKILKDSVKVSAESGSSGSQETNVDAKIEGGARDFEIAFNYRFLEEFLNSIKGEEVKMEFSQVDKPGVFTDPTDSSYLHLIMPVKVQG